MLLLIDAGNSRVKWAVAPIGHADAELGQWSDGGSVEHARIASLAEAWRRHPIGRVLVANVAGPAVRDALEQALAATVGLHPVPVDWFASVAELAGVRNTYQEPGRLGCDRFASMIGARALFPGEPLVVATCGTATTIDALRGDGVFGGGMILPGLELMAASLATHTAQLPWVGAGASVAGAFGTDTETAIAGGCLNAQAGAIDRALAALRAIEGEAVRCVLSGGSAGLVAGQLSAPVELVDNLVLIGLHAAATQC